MSNKMWRIAHTGPLSHLAKMAIVAHCLKIGMKTNYYHLLKPMTIMMNEHVFPFSAMPSEVIA